MLNKMRSWLNIGILIIFIFAILYFIIVSIIGVFNPKKNVTVDVAVINKYMQVDFNKLDAEQKNAIVKDYNLFFSLQDATENFIQYLTDGKYDNTYSVLATEMKSKYEKNDYVAKITEYTNNNFKARTYTDPETGKLMTDYDAIFNNASNLLRAYKVNDNSYLCVTKNANGEYIFIGIRTDSLNKKYNVFYLSL